MGTSYFQPEALFLYSIPSKWIVAICSSNKSNSQQLLTAYCVPDSVPTASLHSDIESAQNLLRWVFYPFTHPRSHSCWAQTPWPDQADLIPKPMVFPPYCTSGIFSGVCIRGWILFYVGTCIAAPKLGGLRTPPVGFTRGKALASHWLLHFYISRCSSHLKRNK